jgi:excisionase family DNA binding protein
MLLEEDLDTIERKSIMTPKQVAGYLQMSPRTVYTHWEKLGGLKVGRTLRFRKEIIDALFRQDEKKMEGGGKARTRKVHSPVSDKDGSERLGSRKAEGTGKPDPREDRNRHRLIDSV